MYVSNTYFTVNNMYKYVYIYNNLFFKICFRVLMQLGDTIVILSYYYLIIPYQGTNIPLLIHNLMISLMTRNVYMNFRYTVKKECLKFTQYAIVSD